MEVLINNSQELLSDIQLFKKLAIFVLQKEKVSEAVELSIGFIDKNKIRALNLEYRGIDEPTDVLAFSFEKGEGASSTDDQGPRLLGDVVICPEVAKENAGIYGNLFTDELNLLLVHGVLHLLGFDHQEAEDERCMKEKESELLDSFGRSNVRGG